MIKSTYVSNGAATLTMISDNGDDLGDGWQIKSLFGSLSFSSDHVTDETYTTEIMKLTNSSLQGSRTVLMNSKLDVRESIKMIADKLLYWSDTGTYISGNATTLTIESDDLLVMNADTSATITTPLTTITGNLDVGAGIDVTGSITCSVDLNIEGDIDMATGKKITWVDNNQYISGTATGITIESDDTLQVNADTSVTFTTPQTTINGNLDITSGLDVTGSITCSGSIDIGADIDMVTGKKITWVDDNQYISGTATGITIESDDTLQVNADTSFPATTPLFHLYSTAP